MSICRYLLCISPRLVSLGRCRGALLAYLVGWFRIIIIIIIIINRDFITKTSYDKPGI